MLIDQLGDDVLSPECARVLDEARVVDVPIRCTWTSGWTMVVEADRINVLGVVKNLINRPPTACPRSEKQSGSSLSRAV